MARSLTNKTGFNAVRESTFQTAPTSGWVQLEVNTPGDMGAEVTTTERDPISTDRQRRASSTTDLDSGFNFEGDLTLSHLLEFVEGFAFASATGVGTQGVSTYACTAVVDGGTGADSFTVAADGDLAANELIYTRGFTNSGNNGLFVLTTGSTATAIKVATGTLTAEASPPANAEIEVAGVQGASGDIQIDANGDLISSALDFTTLGLTAGQFIKIGGTASNTFFATSANNDYARIVSIAANLITLDKKGGTFVVDAGAGKTIQVFYGRFIRNVAIDHASFIERSYTFEIAYDDLQNPTGTGDEYEYPNGNYCNQITLSLPLADKATANFGFVGADTPVPVTVRKTGPSTAKAPNRTELLNTSADIARLQLTEADETALSTDFKSLTLTLNNNVTREKVLGTLGAKYMNYGNFHVDLDAEILFTDSDVAAAVRNNTTVTMDFILANTDGAVAFDFPSIKLGGGKKAFPVDESIRLQAAVMAFKDATLGYSIGISMFPHIPS